MDIGAQPKLMAPAMSVFDTARSTSEIIVGLLKSQGTESLEEHLGFWETEKDAVLFNHPDGLVEFQGVPLMAKAKHRFVAHTRAYLTSRNGQDVARATAMEGPSNMGTHRATATPHALGVNATFWRRDLELPDTESAQLFYRYQNTAEDADEDGSKDRVDDVYVFCMDPVGAPVENVLFPHIGDADRIDGGVKHVSAHHDVFPLLAFQLHYTCIALESRFPGFRHGSTADSLLVTRDGFDMVRLYGWHVPGLGDAEYARIETQYSVYIRNWALMSRFSRGAGGGLAPFAAMLRTLLHRMLRDASISGEGVLAEAAEDADVLNRGNDDEVRKTVITRFASLAGTGKAFNEAVLNFLSLYFEVSRYITYDEKRRSPGFLQTEGGQCSLSDEEGNAVLRALLKEAQLYKDCTIIDYGRPKAFEFGAADAVHSADMGFFTGEGFEFEDSAVVDEMPGAEVEWVPGKKAPALHLDIKDAPSLAYVV